MSRRRIRPLRAALAGGALLALAVAASASAAPLTYSPAAIYPVPSAGSILAHPVALVQVDLNGDGRQDIVTANQNTAELSILINNGSGGFTASIGPSTFGTPTSIAAGDLNGDGKQDVVVADNASAINVFFGNGAGAFSSSTTAFNVDPLLSVAVGDLNGDGRLDVVAGDSSGFVDVFKNLGAGSFTFFDTDPISVNPITSVEIAEMNADGNADVVSTDGTYVLVTPGNGDVTLNGPNTIPTANFGTILDIAVGNLDGINGPDVALVDTTGGTSHFIDSFLNNGDGTFSEGGYAGFNASAAAHLALALGDLNGDGFTDAAVSVSTANTVNTFLGDGAGGWTADAVLNTGAPAGCGTKPWDVDISQFNADTKADLATADFGQGGTGVGTACQLGSNAVSVLLQTPPPPPPPPPGTADLSVTKINSPTGAVVRNSLITYTINVTNNGPATATGVVVTDQVTANRVHTTGTGTVKPASCALNTTTATYTCSIGSLASGASTTLTIKVRVNQTTAGAPSGSVITNTASVSGSPSDPIPANNSSSVSNTVA